MTWQGAFRVFIRVIFIFAYIAFLAASIRHVATFFHNFEADQADWVNPYTLAVSIDLTALVLTVGVMFFRGNMPWYAQGFTWIFIVALTAFSWFVNWEYAMTFQGNDLTVNDTLRLLNPILASSFAFLNLAYSVVAEFFSSKKKTAAELAAEIAELEEMEQHQQRLAAYRSRTRKPGVIERVKNTALEARAAVDEVLKKEEGPSSPEHDLGSLEVAQTPPLNEPDNEPITEPEILLVDEPEIEPNLADYPVTDEQPTVSPAGSSLRRITTPLPELVDEPVLNQQRNTDKLQRATSGSKKGSNKEPEVVKKIRTRLKRNQTVTPTQLANDYDITPQYAGRIRAQILKELA